MANSLSVPLREFLHVHTVRVITASFEEVRGVSLNEWSDGSEILESMIKSLRSCRRTERDISQSHPACQITYVRATVDELPLLFSELGQSVAQELDEPWWILSKVQWIGEPSDGGVKVVLSCLFVCTIRQLEALTALYVQLTLVRVTVRDGKVPVKRDTDLATRGGFVVVSVQLGGVRMGQEQVVTSSVWLGERFVAAIAHFSFQQHCLIPLALLTERMHLHRNPTYRSPMAR